MGREHYDSFSHLTVIMKIIYFIVDGRSCNFIRRRRLNKVGSKAAPPADLKKGTEHMTALKPSTKCMKKHTPTNISAAVISSPPSLRGNLLAAKNTRAGISSSMTGALNIFPTRNLVNDMAACTATAAFHSARKATFTRGRSIWRGCSGIAAGISDNEPAVYSVDVWAAGG